MKTKANTTSEQSNEKSMEVGYPRMAEIEEQEKKDNFKSPTFFPLFMYLKLNNIIM